MSVIIFGDFTNHEIEKLSKAAKCVRKKQKKVTQIVSKIVQKCVMPLFISCSRDILSTASKNNIFAFLIDYHQSSTIIKYYSHLYKHE